MIGLSNTSYASLETCASVVSDSSNEHSQLEDDKYIVFVTGAIESKGFQFQAARSLGLSVIILDSECSAGQFLVKNGSIDRFVAVELSADVNVATEQCVRVIKSLDLNIAGVVTFMEMAVLLTSRVADAMGLPGMCPEGVAIARDKRMLREASKAAGLGSVQACWIKCESDLAIAAGQVGFPSVLKPVVGADSLGVKRVDNFDELRTAFLEAKLVMGSLVISSGLLTTSTSSALSAASADLPVEFLLEEYLDGPEVDVDLVLHEGRCCYSAVSDNGVTVEPYFTETYGILPSLLPIDDQTALTTLAVESVLAIGLDSGVFHIEAKLTSRGPRLIEVNARLGGGPIREMHKRVFGVDLAAEQLRLAVGLAPEASLPLGAPRRSFAYMTTNAVASGTVGSDLSFLDKYSPMVDRLTCRVQPGDRIVGPADGQPTWLVEVWMERAGDGLVEDICQVSDAIASEFAAHYDH